MSRRWFKIGALERLYRRVEEQGMERLRVRERVKEGDIYEDGWLTLHYYPVMFHLYAGLALLLALALSFMAWLTVEVEGERALIYAESSLFALMGLSLINEDRAVVWMGPDGIGAKSPWRWWSVELRWDEVEELRWGGQALMWYRIKGPGGTIQVHAWLGERILEDHFAKHLTEEVAKEAVAKANSIERHKWRDFWKQRVNEAFDLLGE